MVPAVSVIVTAPPAATFARSAGPAGSIGARIRSALAGGQSLTVGQLAHALGMSGDLDEIAFAVEELQASGDVHRLNLGGSHRYQVRGTAAAVPA